jgi:hypothetical protein
MNQPTVTVSSIFIPLIRNGLPNERMLHHKFCCKFAFRLSISEWKKQKAVKEIFRAKRRKMKKRN